jgi:ADP-heptose:LPS heptosyltransferase
VLAACLAGSPPEKLPPPLVGAGCAPALFGILAEGLGDRFEPALCDLYARLFAQAIPGADAERYFRVRRPRAIACQPRRVFVLSRVTLGADIAVTSVLVDAAKQRFPNAQIVFVGPRKNFELFAFDSRLKHAPLDYRRGDIHAAWRQLQGLVDDLVIDPDSRLTQLGLLPVGEEDRYHLFESRGYGGSGSLALSELASRWAEETFSVSGAKPYLACGKGPSSFPPRVAVSLGVGANPTKRIPDPFESELLALLAARGMTVVVDRGAGGEEAARVQRAVARAGIEVAYWDGSFAGFAKMISGAALYVGYDSAGQHAAAAAGVPLICVFGGFPVPRMFDRWRPIAPNATVIRVDEPDPVKVLERVRRALG